MPVSSPPPPELAATARPPSKDAGQPTRARCARTQAALLSTRRIQMHTEKEKTALNKLQNLVSQTPEGGRCRVQKIIAQP